MSEEEYTLPRGLQPRTMLRLISDLRLDLKDDSNLWSPDELERAITKSISDLSRFLPRELILDITLASDDITDYVSIDLAGYINADDGMEGMIRVRRVEYPTGEIPQSFCQHDVFGTLLTITGMGESSEQERLSVGKTIRIYYDAPHIIPSHDEAGSVPAFLDDTILLASSAYALFQYALKFMHQSDVDMTAAGLALAACGVALDKVSVYLTNNAGEDAKSWLTKITTDIANLRTAVSASLNSAQAYLIAVDADTDAADSARANYIPTYVDGASAPSSKKYLTDGAALLNKIADGGEGQEVPLAYREYARSVAEALVGPHEEDRRLLAQNATLRTNAAMVYAQEVAQRISNLRSYIEQATAWGEIAGMFIREAEQRLAEAVHYSTTGTQAMLLAERFQVIATDRRNEVWSIWRDRTQLIGDYSQSSMRQMPG